MDKDKMINFIVENEDIEETKEFFRNFHNQIVKAREFIYGKYYNQSLNEWINEDMEKVYNYLTFSDIK